MKLWHILLLVVLGLTLGSSIPKSSSLGFNEDLSKASAYICSESFLIPLDFNQKVTGQPIYLGCVPEKVAVDYQRQIAYLILAESSQIFPFNLKTLQMETSIELPFHLKEIVLNREGDTAYVIHKNSSHIVQLNLLNREFQFLAELERLPLHILINSTETTLYLTTQNSKELTILEMIDPIPKSFPLFEQEPLAVALLGSGKIVSIEQGAHEICLYSLNEEERQFIPIAIEPELKKEGAILHVNSDCPFGYVTYLNSTLIHKVDFADQKVESNLKLEEEIGQITDLSVSSITNRNEQNAIYHDHVIRDKYEVKVNPVTSGEVAAPLALASIFISPFNPNSVAINDEITLIANLAGSFGYPSGAVSFKNGDILLGQAEVLGLDSTRGLASLDIVFTAIGPHQITAIYEPTNPNYSTNASLPIQLIAKYGTSMTLSSLEITSSYGQNVAFIADVSGGDNPTGNVSFSDENGIVLGSVGLSNGTATISRNTLSAGNHKISGNYPGNSTYLNSSSTLDFQVEKAVPNLEITSPTESIFGESVTITANLAKAASNVDFPKGNVTFTLGSVVEISSLQDGLASISTSQLSAGIYDIAIDYSGDSNYTKVSQSSSLQITQAIPSINVYSSTTESIFGQAVTLSAELPNEVTGDVTFKYSGTTLGIAPVLDGLASISTAILPVGNNAIEVYYSGDLNYKEADASLTQRVQKAETTTSLSSSINPSSVDQTVVFKANVQSAAQAPIPTGLVTFFDGEIALFSGYLDENGALTCTVSNLNVGTHEITAQFAEGMNYQGSQSSVLKQIVDEHEVLSPPQDLEGHRLVNKFLNKTQLVDILTWQPPSSGIPLTYKVYQDAQLTKLLAEISSERPLIYEAKVSKKHKSSTYYLVAVYSSGISNPVKIRVLPLKK